MYLKIQYPSINLSILNVPHVFFKKDFILNYFMFNYMSVHKSMCEYVQVSSGVREARGGRIHSS